VLSGRVHPSPVQQSLRKASVYEGDAAEFRCKFYEMYDAKIVWNKHRKEISSQAIVTIRKSPYNETLFIVSRFYSMLIFECL